MEAIDDSVDRCCNMLMLCWLVLTVLIWFQKIVLFFWELCWCMLLVLTVLTVQTDNDYLSEQMEAIDDSVDRCCNMLMLCWLVLTMLIWFQKISYVFLRGLLTGVARDAWCWLCWHSWQRETGFETDPEPLMLVYLHVATWCYMLTSVDKCWWKCWI